jgi:hypothetical protein
MTDATQEPQDQRDEYDDEPEVIEPEDGGTAQLSPEDEVDPVTARNPDPAAMSEHERNARHAEQYGL